MPGRAGMHAHAWRQPWHAGSSFRPDRLAPHTNTQAQALCRTASGQASCRVHETCGFAIRAAQGRGHGAAYTQELSFPNRRQGLRSPRGWPVKSRKHKAGFKGAKAHTGTGAKAAAPVASSTSPTAAARGALPCPANMAACPLERTILWEGNATNFGVPRDPKLAGPQSVREIAWRLPIAGLPRSAIATRFRSP
jgi:hypothetical protein